MAPLKKVESLYLMAQKILVKLLDAAYVNEIDNDSDSDNEDNVVEIDSIKNYIGVLPPNVNDDFLSILLDDNRDSDSDDYDDDQEYCQDVVLLFSNASSRSARFNYWVKDDLGMLSS